MNYYELKCIAYLKQNINFKESFEVLSRFISYTMSQTQQYRELHTKRGYKFYNFSNFYPTENDQVYKKGNTYQFIIRSLDASFIDTLSKTLRQNIDNQHFQVIQTNQKSIRQFFVSELYSITPVIVTVEKELFWTTEKDGDIMKLQRLLHDNLEKKYFDFYGEKLSSEQNFIQLLEIKNRKPQNIWVNKKKNYFRFFGNKFRIVPNEDEVSQKLAFMALACGLGEKNSFGGGFILSKGMKV